MSVATKVLDVAEVRALLVRAVEEKGADYVYVNPDGMKASNGEVACSNWDAQGNPSCIVGHVLVWVGAKPSNFLQDAGVAEVNEELNIFTRTAERALLFAQARQDSGATWGEALAEFDRVVAESQS